MKNAPSTEPEAQVEPEAQAVPAFGPPQHPGESIDQRTGHPASLSGGTREHLRQQLEQKREADEREADELIAELEQKLSATVTSSDGALDVRKLNQLVRAELEKMVGDPESGVLATRTLQRLDQRDRIVRRGSGVMTLSR